MVISMMGNFMALEISDGGYNMIILILNEMFAFFGYEN